MEDLTRAIADNTRSSKELNNTMKSMTPTSTGTGECTSRFV